MNKKSKIFLTERHKNRCNSGNNKNFKNTSLNRKINKKKIKIFLTEKFQKLCIP